MWQYGKRPSVWSRCVSLSNYRQIEIHEQCYIASISVGNGQLCRLELLQAFVRNIKFKVDVCLWRWVRRGGGFHHENSTFIIIFSHLYPFCGFDDSSWPWLQLSERRGTVGEVSTLSKQWMPGDSEHVWAGQFDSWISKRRKKKTHHHRDHVSAVYIIVIPYPC